jgi:hypothetical protein
MGERDALIWRVPVSAKPIMARAPISMQIVISRPLRSLRIIKGPPLVERRAHRQVLFLPDRPDAHKRRSEQYRHGERTKAAIAERQKFSALQRAEVRRVAMRRRAQGVTFSQQPFANRQNVCLKSASVRFT